MLTPGSPAPDFSLLDQHRAVHALSAYRNKRVLIYFYPKDDTPGCTKEACAMRDSYADFEAAGVKVFGVSADSPESHKLFAEKYRLPFALLSDPDKKVIESYGAKGLIMNKRISYLIGPDGSIEKAYLDVDPTTHAAEILKDLAR